MAEFRFFWGRLNERCWRHSCTSLQRACLYGIRSCFIAFANIIKNLKFCKEDIVGWKPDVVILIDYPGFNLKIAKFLRKNTKIPVYYYISPKIWAWKEWRIRAIKRDVKEMFSYFAFRNRFL